MASPPTDPTSMCIAGACAGDTSSRDRLVERFTPALLAQARFRMSRPVRGVEPEDLVQECWASALPKLRGLSPGADGWTATLLRFLSVILLRRLNDQLRRLARRGGRDIGTGGRDDDGDPMQAVPAEVTGIVSRLARQHRAGAVQQAIDALPEDERRVLLMRGIEQLPNKEVARLLGVDDATVTRRYQKALEHLRRALPESIFAELS